MCGVLSVVCCVVVLLGCGVLSVVCCVVLVPTRRVSHAARVDPRAQRGGGGGDAQ
jgi:hypothetical protein